jgi:putative oxidoreductase
MNSFPFLTTAQWLNLFRIGVAVLMMAHGVMRIAAGTVDDFGGFLSGKGFPLGAALAWFLTLFEIAGGLILAAGYLRKIISAVFILELLGGIILVHAPRGWFVVGHTAGGVEYSVLLIICFLVIASTQPTAGKT